METFVNNIFPSGTTKWEQSKVVSHFQHTVKCRAPNHIPYVTLGRHIPDFGR